MMSKNLQNLKSFSQKAFTTQIALWYSKYIWYLLQCLSLVLLIHREQHYLNLKKKKKQQQPSNNYFKDISFIKYHIFKNKCMDRENIV